MEYREIDSGVKIPIIGLGTWVMGGRETGNQSRDEEDVDAIRAAIDLGMTHIDTAEMYGAGHCEELVGRAVEPYDRGELFITTKVWHNHLRYDDLISAIKASLGRLGMDYVDLFLVHWPNPHVPLQETMRAMEYCAEEGYTRLIGVSNFPVDLMVEAQSYLKEHRLVADQVHYSLMEQGPSQELLPHCKENDVTLIAYTPLEKGQLARHGNLVLDELAAKHGKTQAQVSLNWLISQEKVVAIPKSSRLEHLRENVGTLGWRLSNEDHRRLGEAFS